MTDIWYVGIDPDVDKSGLAIVSKQEKSVILCQRESFFSIIDKIKTLATTVDTKVIFVVEAGWKVKKANFHKIKGAAGEAIARGVGANHQVGKLIVEFCKMNDLNVIEAAPLLKCWKGPGKKITKEEILEFATGTPNVTNQEDRDAILLAWSFANLPIKIKPRK